MCARSAPCLFEIVAKGFSFIISGVIYGVGGFLGRVFVLTGACLSKIELRTESYCLHSAERFSLVSLLDPS